MQGDIGISRLRPLSAQQIKVVGWSGWWWWGGWGDCFWVGWLAIPLLPFPPLSPNLGDPELPRLLAADLQHTPTGGGGRRHRDDQKEGGSHGSGPRFSDAFPGYDLKSRPAFFFESNHLTHHPSSNFPNGRASWSSPTTVFAVQWRAQGR